MASRCLRRTGAEGETADEQELGEIHRIVDSVSAVGGDEGDQPPPASVSWGLALFLNITR